MKNTKIKINLPKQLTINIPSLGEIPLENVMEIIAKDGKDYIYRMIEQRVIEAFAKKHEKRIGKAVRDLMAEKEDEILKILNLK